MSASVSRTPAPSFSPSRERREGATWPSRARLRVRSRRPKRSAIRAAPLAAALGALTVTLESSTSSLRGRFERALRHRPMPGNFLHIGPELRQDYPLNLSISISGGKETNQDSPSNGERTGKSPACQSGLSGSELWSGGRCSARSDRQVRWKAASQRVTTPWAVGFRASRARSAESGCLGMQL